MAMTKARLSNVVLGTAERTRLPLQLEKLACCKDCPYLFLRFFSLASPISLSRKNKVLQGTPILLSLISHLSTRYKEKPIKPCSRAMTKKAMKLTYIPQKTLSHAQRNNEARRRTHWLWRRRQRVGRRWWLWCLGSCCVLVICIGID